MKIEKLRSPLINKGEISSNDIEEILSGNQGYDGYGNPEISCSGVIGSCKESCRDGCKETDKDGRPCSKNCKSGCASGCSGHCQLTK